MDLIKRYSNILCLGIAVLCFTACYSPVDGCLDPESTNYSIAGDRDCEDCCVYPKIKLSVFHQYGDTTLFLEDTLINNLGQEYSIIKYVYLLSDFKMRTTDDITYEVEDSIQLDISSGTQFVKDDVIRVRRDVFTYEYGTIVYEGDGEEISFKVGLSELLNKNPFTSPVSGHPLTSDVDSLYREDINDYVFQRVQVAQGMDFQDTVIYDVVALQDVSFTFPVPYESVRGKDKTVIIEAKYDTWFEDVDFTTDTKEEIENQMGVKSKSMFSARL